MPVSGTTAGLGLSRGDVAKGVRELLGGCFTDKNGETRTPAKILAVLSVYIWHSWYYGRLDDMLPFESTRRLKKSDDDGCGPDLGMLQFVDAAVSFKVNPFAYQKTNTRGGSLWREGVRGCA